MACGSSLEDSAPSSRPAFMLGKTFWRRVAEAPPSAADSRWLRALESGISRGRKAALAVNRQGCDSLPRDSRTGQRHWLCTGSKDQGVEFWLLRERRLPAACLLREAARAQTRTRAPNRELSCRSVQEAQGGAPFPCSLGSRLRRSV